MKKQWANLFGRIWGWAILFFLVENIYPCICFCKWKLWNLNLVNDVCWFLSRSPQKWPSHRRVFSTIVRERIIRSGRFFFLQMKALKFIYLNLINDFCWFLSRSPQKWLSLFIFEHFSGHFVFSGSGSPLRSHPWHHQHSYNGFRGFWCPRGSSHSVFKF